MMRFSELNQILSKIYFNTNHPAAYGGITQLYKYAKQLDNRITFNDVKTWLSGQFSYSLHKPARKKFSRNKIFVKYIDEQWEADLIDFQNFAQVNNQNKFILIIIDVFSKYLFAYPIKNKTSLEVVSKFKDLFKRRKPAKLRTDKGLEFQNKLLKALCKKYDVLFFSSENLDVKCAVAERVIGTIKRKLFRYFTKNGTRRYVDILDKIIHAYNNSYHRSIKMRPNDVVHENESTVFKNLYGTENKLDVFFQKKIAPKLKVGDTVRQKYSLSTLDKSYYPLWTDMVYTINKVHGKVTKPQYELALDGNVFKKKFYPEEVQKVLVNKNTLWLIEKILGYRTKRGVKEAQVKFKGYPDSYNQWLPLNQIRNL